MSTREFTFTEGASDKFWKITLDNKTTTVNFGRRGTSGQVQTKEFSTAEEAKKNYDKLIAEKTKKGYVETSASSGGQAVAAAAVAVKTAPARTAVKKEQSAQSSSVPEPEPQPHAPTKPAPVLIANLDAPRKILSDPRDWLWATWRKTEIALPEVRAFDRESCLKKLPGLRRLHGRYNYEYDWAALNIPAAISREEAAFWYVAMCAVDYNNDPAKVAKQMQDQKIPVSFKPKDLAKDLKSHRPPEILLAIRILLEPEELVEAIVEDVTTVKKGASSWSHENWFDVNDLIGMQRYVLPYWPAELKEELRKRIRPKVTPQNWPGSQL